MQDRCRCRLLLLVLTRVRGVSTVKNKVFGVSQEKRYKGVCECVEEEALFFLEEGRWKEEGRFQEREARITRR